MKRHLSIGSNYENSLFPLPGSKNTAVAWDRLLRAKGSHGTLLLEQHATRQGIAAAITEMFAASRPGDTCTITYAGHGLTINYQPPGQPAQLIHALVPYDASSDYNLSIPTYQWAAKMETRPRGVRLFTCIDSCFSAGFHADAMALDVRSQAIPGVHTVTTRFQPFGGLGGHIPGMTTATDSVAAGPGYLSMHPGEADQVTIQTIFPPANDWFCLFSKEILNTAIANNWSYGQIFSAAAQLSSKRFPKAHPRLIGDPAMAKTAFLS